MGMHSCIVNIPLHPKMNSCVCAWYTGSMNTLTTPQEVIRFWFEELESRQWFEASEEIDVRITERFGATLIAARGGELGTWCKTPDGCLALVIVLDQFSRNIHRDTPEAYTSDAQALAIARDAVARDDDVEIPPLRRVFLYMPFMHAEDLTAQEQGVALFQRLAQEESAVQANLSYALRYRDIIARFGRFPHRNGILGRETTPQEKSYLEAERS
jgi:uncharacterized protein (DUF924 family)